MDRLDVYDDMPSAMRAYLSSYGWHFNKALCEEAVGKMKTREGKPLQAMGKDEVEELMKQHNIKLKNDVGYDAVYVFNMAMADYYGSSILDKQHVAMFVRDYLDDPDGTPTRALDEYVGRCIGAGTPVMWEDVI
jgi:hypothetical protein